MSVHLYLDGLSVSFSNGFGAHNLGRAKLKLYAGNVLYSFLLPPSWIVIYLPSPELKCPSRGSPEEFLRPWTDGYANIARAQAGLILKIGGNFLEVLVKEGPVLTLKHFLLHEHETEHASQE